MGHSFGDGWSSEDRWNRLVLKDGKPTGWVFRTAGNYDGTLIGRRLLEALDSGKKDVSALANEFGEGRLVSPDRRHSLSDGWYDGGYFWRSLRRDGHPTSFLWREGGRGSSTMVEKLNMMLAAADAGMPLSELAGQFRELVSSDVRNPAVDPVLRDAKSLSSGTLAGLIREMGVPNSESSKYATIDRVRLAFINHIETCATKFETWPAAWQAFRTTPQAIEAVAGGPVKAEGVRCEYELHFWDRPKAVFESLSDLDVAFRKAVAEAPVGDKGQLEAVVYRRSGERGGAAKTHGHRLSSGFAEVRPLIGWENAEMEPLVLAKATSEGKTFAEIFDGARESLKTMAESWHRSRGQTPVEFLRLFASLNQAEEIHVIKSLRAVKPEDGEPMNSIVSRRAAAVSTALDRIQDARGLPPIQPLPPPGGHRTGYTLREGDRLECQKIAKAVVRFFGASTPACIIRTEQDRDGWHWVRVADMDGHPLRMGTGGFQVGQIQCGHASEAVVVEAELRRALDVETRRVAVGSVKQHDFTAALAEVAKAEEAARRQNAEKVVQPELPLSGPRL